MFVRTAREKAAGADSSDLRQIMAPQVGLEPTTPRLTEVITHYYHVSLTATAKFSDTFIHLFAWSIPAFNAMPCDSVSLPCASLTEWHTFQHRPPCREFDLLLVSFWASPRTPMGVKTKRPTSARCREKLSGFADNSVASLSPKVKEYLRNVYPISLVLETTQSCARARGRAKPASSCRVDRSLSQNNLQLAIGPLKWSKPQVVWTCCGYSSKSQL